MIKRVKRTVRRVRKWARERAERNTPEYLYLSRSTDLADLERRMRALRNGEVRVCALYTVRG